MWDDIIISVITSLICGVITGYYVYYRTTSRERKNYAYHFWNSYLFKCLEKYEINVPIEELTYITIIGNKESKWYNDIYKVFDIMKPIDDKKYSNDETKEINAILEAIKELNIWAKKQGIIKKR